MDEFVLVVGTKRYSTWSLRPYMALRHAGATFQEEEVTLRQPDTKAQILAHSPSGKVPLLIHNGLKVWDSLAICEYVAELFPEAGLWPAERDARAVARAVSAEMHAGFQALRQVMPMDISLHAPMSGIPPEVQADIDRVTAIWRDCRARFGQGGPFLFGRFTIADAMYAPVVSRFTTYGVGVDDVSAAYMQAIWDLPAMRDWAAAATA
nr:glutathione S-transferase family protein [Telmatospirillum sp. J64-1]